MNARMGLKVYSLYVNKQLNMQEVASQLNIPKQSVSKHLREAEEVSKDMARNIAKRRKEESIHASTRGAEVSNSKRRELHTSNR